MGKASKKTPPKDEKQKKISSFFTTGAQSKDQPSHLFSSVGPSSKSRAKLSLQKKKSSSIIPETKCQNEDVVIIDDSPKLESKYSVNKLRPNSSSIGFRNEEKFKKTAAFGASHDDPVQVTAPPTSTSPSRQKNSERNNGALYQQIRKPSNDLKCSANIGSSPVSRDSGLTDTNMESEEKTIGKLLGGSKSCIPEDNHQEHMRLMRLKYFNKPHVSEESGTDEINCIPETQDFMNDLPCGSKDLIDTEIVLPGKISTVNEKVKAMPESVSPVKGNCSDTLFTPLKNPTDISFTGDDSDIIPDTPELSTSTFGVQNTSRDSSKTFDPVLGRRTKKVLHRTFLSSASSFTPPFPCSRAKKPKPKSKINKARSLEDALKETDVEKLEKWNPGSLGYSTLVSEAGLDRDQSKTLKIEKGDGNKDAVKDLQKCSGIKRGSARPKGESPNPKRLNRNPSGGISKAQQDTSGSCLESSEKKDGENCKIRLKFDPTLQTGSKLKANVHIKNPQFSKPSGKLKSGLQNVSVGKLDSVAMETGTGSGEQEEDGLGDILSELKQELSQKYSPQVKLNKKAKGRTTAALYHPTSKSKIEKVDDNETLIKDGDYNLMETGMELDKDDLSDILSELKENAPIVKNKTKKSPTSKIQTSPVEGKVEKYPRYNDNGNFFEKDPDKEMHQHHSKDETEEILFVKSKSVIGSLEKEITPNCCSEAMECEPFNINHVNEPKAIAGESEISFDIEIDADLEEELARNLQQLSPFKSSNDGDNGDVSFNPASTLPPARAFGRFTVTEVNKSRDVISMNVESDYDKVKKTKSVILEGFWTDTHVNTGDKIHLIGTYGDADNISVTDKENLVIVNPDLLISGTSVVSSVHCMRRSVLNEKFKGYDGKNIYMLHGSIIHSFFQQVVQQRAFSTPAMKVIAEKVLKENKFLHEMYGQAVTEATVMEEIEKYMPQVLTWTEKYVPPKTYTLGQKKSDAELCITNVKDIEENIWSPRYGVKGKIDLTVEVKIHKSQKHKIVPLELKTGRPTYSIEHKGQVTLYSMMIGDRREDPDSGLLLYLKDGSMKPIPADYQNKRGLIQLRNELSHYLKQSVTKTENGSFGRLPPTLNQRRMCAKCPQLLNCAAFQRSVENDPAPDGHAMSDLVPEAIGHLEPHHLKYYAHWIRLLHLEQAASGPRSSISDVWCKTAWERELIGECFSGMLVKREGCSSTPSDSGQYIQAFRRLSRHPSKTSLTAVGLTKGDSVVVSAENKTLIALSTGFVHEVTLTQVTVSVDRDLRCYPDYESTVFRLDKCDTFNTIGTNFTNLARLMDNNSCSERLRQIVIDKCSPEFELTMSKGAIEKVKTIFKFLNKPQKTAILKVLMAKHYVLIKGYPGTGKTSTIVALVRILVELGHSVLLASYTHSAVDNILLKLKKYIVDFTRIGRAGRIHTDIQPYAAELNTKTLTTVDELRQFYESKSVIATTCLGTNHVVFSQRRFDVCIIDEASQVLQPACLGPLFCSHKFVLVGDPKQLPPVVQSKEAREAGMSQSLFARLDDTGGTYELNLQYRMNTEIMRLSNELVYNGALKCGSETVANGILQMSTEHDLYESCPKWLQLALSSKSGHQVAFLNTGQVAQPVSAAKDSGVCSVIEAAAILQLTQAAVQCGVSECDIGVIAVYRQQVKLLRERLTKHRLLDVEVNTVDQYQGRDKPLIIVSFVKRGAQSGHVSEIMKDVRRLNVALTRAKHKLVLVGCAKTLQGYEPLERLLKQLKPHQIIDLPADLELEC